MRFLLFMVGMVVAGYAGTLTISGPVQLSGPLGVLTNPGDSSAPPPDPPPVIEADILITFDTNSVGSTLTTNDVLATVRGVGFQTIQEPNSLTGFTLTNSMGPLPFTLNIGGTSYGTNNTNAVRYSHDSSPAQWVQLRYLVDLTNVCIAFQFRTTFNGPTGGTFDLLQTQGSGGDDWISFYIRDVNPPYLQAHTGAATFGDALYLTANTIYWGQVTRSNHVGYLELFDSTGTNYLGTSINPGSTNYLFRYLQFGQFGHPAVPGNVTEFDTVLVRTNGMRILRQL